VASAPVIVLTGPPGSGKTTVAPLVADAFDPSVCFDTDLLWHKIRHGYVEPWRPGSDRQNRTVLGAAAAAVAAFATGGYTVVVDGIIGPWMLDVVAGILRERAPRSPAHYAVLRPPLDVTLGRATGRDATALRDAGPITDLWRQFADLGEFESHVVAAPGSDPDPAAVGRAILTRVEDGSLRI
jgi:hypothetical protein